VRGRPNPLIPPLAAVTEFWEGVPHAKLASNLEQWAAGRRASGREQAWCRSNELCVHGPPAVVRMRRPQWRDVRTCCLAHAHSFGREAGCEAGASSGGVLSVGWGRGVATPCALAASQRLLGGQWMEVGMCEWEWNAARFRRTSALLLLLLLLRPLPLPVPPLAP
jgi:hypothetical protein